MGRGVAVIVYAFCVVGLATIVLVSIVVRCYLALTHLIIVCWPLIGV